MNKYIQATLIFIGIWFTASLLNGILSGFSIVVLDGNGMYNGGGKFAMAMFFSFVFSVPIVGLVWFITLMAQASGKKGDALLQFVLGAALVCSAAGGLFFICAFATEFKNARFVVALCIIASALASVLFFRKKIKNNA